MVERASLNHFCISQTAKETKLSFSEALSLQTRRSAEVKERMKRIIRGILLWTGNKEGEIHYFEPDLIKQSAFLYAS